jgi:hypothetical protein
MIASALDASHRGRYTSASFRGVAQPGSAHGSGPWSRRFKSFRPDSRAQIERSALSAFWAIDFWAIDFWAIDFWAIDFWAIDFWAIDFWAIDFWAIDFSGHQSRTRRSVGIEPGKNAQLVVLQLDIGGLAASSK